MTKKIQPQWIVGFVDGEGCFQARVSKNSKSKFGSYIQIEFQVTQDERDVRLLYALIENFQCGQVYKQTSTCYRFRVGKIKDLTEKVIPFFEKHPLKTKKNVEFKRFCKLCFKLHAKVHLTADGFEECKRLAESLRYKKNPGEE